MSREQARKREGGNVLGEFIHEVLLAVLHLERRTEPFWRPYTNALFREPSAAVIQALINLQRKNEGLQLAEEKLLPDEERAFASITEAFGEYMKRKYRDGEFERGGNTKTHGLLRAEVKIRADLPDELKQGIFRTARTFPAWVRFSGPGPDSPPDIDDVGFMSMSVKLMDVPGPKLSPDEKHTQDLLTVCTPAFVTGNVIDNARLHSRLLSRTSLFYFFDPRHPRILDFLMQALWNETQTSPLECQYYSCVPYLLGEGRAMQYSLRPRSKERSRIPNLPGRPPDNYLRDNMRATLKERDAVFDLLIQVQTDAHAMPIEDAAVRWPTRLSPYVVAAEIRIPKQDFDSPAQLRFADKLSFTPWHCIPEHRPLGNMNRARRRMYAELTRLRQSRNRVAHVEPTGAETFEPEPKPAAKPAVRADVSRPS